MGVRDSTLFALNRWLGRYGQVDWLLGVGRSGTTWLASLVNAEGRLRKVFEPFHPRRNPELAGLWAPHQYLRPGTPNHALERAVRRIFTGRVDSQRPAAGYPKRLLYDGLLVKDVFANLIAPWVHAELPHVRQVLLLRHPLDVARSKLELDDWYWPRESAHLLTQNDLMADHLGAYAEVLGNARTQLEKYVALWCAAALVPLRALPPGELHVVFYEHLRTEPERELALLCRFLGREMPRHDLLASAISRPSGTSRRKQGHPVLASVMSPGKGIDTSDLARALDILDAFGLSGLYAEEHAPDAAVAAELVARRLPCLTGHLEVGRSGTASGITPEPLPQPLQGAP